jgi:cytochrome P450
MTVASLDLDTLDLSDASLYERGFPHDIFTALRRDAPVWWHEAPAPPPGFAGQPEGFFVVSRHEDVQAANRNTEVFCAIDGPSLGSPAEMRGTMLVSMDGKPHTRQRKLISAGFTPRMVGRVEEQARTWAVQIVDRALERGTCDFVQEVAYQLPMHMIADIVGIPVEDRGWLFELTQNILGAGDPDNPVAMEEHRGLQAEMFVYAQKLGREKRANPQDDIWTLLSTLEVETEDGKRERMGELELDMFFFLLTLAGSETTRSAIAGGLAALIENPDQFAILRGDEGVTRTAVDEIVRFTSPVSYFARRATRDTEIRGVPIAEGQRISLWYPSANRDEDVFDDPFRFDVRRKENPHVAFGGGGPHFCLGANLARREITILFEELLARTREIEILEPPTWGALSIYNPILTFMKKLPVRLSAA